MDDKILAFNEYIDSFKKLDITSKREEFIKSLKIFLAILLSIAEQDNIQVECLRSIEELTIKNSKISEDVFIELALEYLENIKEVFGQYMLGKENY